MVDTIVLRIHNLHQYPRILEALRKEGEGQYTSVLDTPHDKEAVDFETGEITKDRFLQVKQLHYSDTGNTFTIYKNKILTSSHYYLAYSVRVDRDFVEMNFSIPKYMYGTNIMQFVPHKFEDHPYNSDDLNSLEFNTKITYERLITFISSFINTWFKDIHINKEDIEINRLDLCYNQYFDSKEDALKYLDYQKRIKKKYLKKTTKNKVDWGTSIFIQNARYAAKIYHKGSEYASSKGERKHHLAMNKKLGNDYFEVESKYDNGVMSCEGLEDTANRILRYEITFKKPYMSYLFKKHLFARNCETWQQAKHDYNEVEKIVKKIRDNRIKGLSILHLEKQYRNLPPEKKVYHKTYSKIINRTNSFRLAISEEDEVKNTSLNACLVDNKGIFKPPTMALFTRELLDEMFNVFLNFKEEFRISSLDKFTDTTKRVIAYNKDVEKYNNSLPEGSKDRKTRISETYINSILMLLQSHSFDELVQLKIISARTKYNYINALDKIGLSKNHLAVDNLEIKKSESFEDYHLQFN
nr:phage/plasmid replication protein [uncultured Carboxylicivirga sp.]